MEIRQPEGVAAAASVVYGGLRWSGIDQLGVVDGVLCEVIIAAPPRQWRHIDEMVAVDEHVRSNSSYELAAESAGAEEFCNFATSTMLQDSDEIESPYASVLVPSDHRFPVDVSLGSGTVEMDSCRGWSNREVACGND